MTGTNSRGPGGYIPKGGQEPGIPPIRGTAAAKAHDPVNHPKHYNAHPSGVECIEVVRHMSFNLGNVIKYIWRAGHKGATIEDLKKAQFYLNDEINRMEAAE